MALGRECTTLRDCGSAGDVADDIGSDFSPGYLESLPRTSFSSSQCVAPYPYDVDISVSSSPIVTTRGTETWTKPARNVCGGVRQFLRKALKDVNFTGVSNEERFVADRPKRPDKNLQTLCLAANLNKEELKFFYRAFKQECPSGTAEAKHFRTILNKYFPVGDCSGYATQLFNAFDTKRKGYITFEELLMGISSLSRGSVSDKLRWVFNLYDANADGAISRQELKSVIIAIHRLAITGYGLVPPRKDPGRAGDHSFSSILHGDSIDEQTNRVFQKLDLNGDGVVTLDVFLQACTQDEALLKSIENLSLMSSMFW